MVTSLIIAESSSIAVLSSFLKNEPFAVPETAITYQVGLALIMSGKPDLVFIDISFVRQHHAELIELKSRCTFILLTESANDTGKYRGLIYECLLKPFDVEDFKRFSTSYLILWVIEVAKITVEPSSAVQFIIKGGDKKGEDFRMLLTDILFIEGYGNYIKIHSVNGSVSIIPTTLKASLAMLPPQHFSRVHNSNIINHSRIRFIKDDCIYLDDKNNTIVQIGNAFKSKFLAKKDVKSKKKKLKANIIDKGFVLLHIIVTSICQDMCDFLDVI